MNELTLTELDMGISIPKILSSSKPSVDHRGKVWSGLLSLYYVISGLDIKNHAEHSHSN